MTEKQLKLLKAIFQCEKDLNRCRVADLSVALNLSHPPISIMLKKLELSEYITRDKVKRGQSRNISITEKGFRVLCM